MDIVRAGIPQSRIPPLLNYGGNGGNEGKRERAKNPNLNFNSKNLILSQHSPRHTTYVL